MKRLKTWLKKKTKDHLDQVMLVKVEYWHNAEADLGPLMEYVGMTTEEWQAWAVNQAYPKNAFWRLRLTIAEKAYRMFSM